MKFVIKDSSVVEEDKPVEISIKKDWEGDIEVMANGFCIFWLRKSGRLLRYKQDVCKEQVQKMGFQLNSEDRIKTEGE